MVTTLVKRRSSKVVQRSYKKSLVRKKLRFLGRERPRRIERQTACSHSVNAKDPGSGEKCDDVDAHRRHVAIVVGDLLLRECRAGRSAPCAGGVTNELRDHALTRRSDEYRIAERNNARELDQRGERVLSPFRKSDSWIESNPPRMNAGSLGCCNALLEFGQNLADRIRSIDSRVVTRHVGDRSARMHEHDVAARLRAHARHLRIEGHSGNVVHDRSSFAKSGAGNFCLHRIDRDWYIAPPRANRPDDGEHSPELLASR